MALQEEFGFITPLPYGYGAELEWNADHHPSPTLSVMSRMVIHAAALAVAENPGAKLLLTGESVDELPLPSTMGALTAAAIARGVNPDSIIDLNELAGKTFNNTAAQVAALTGYQRNKPSMNAQNTLLIALDYHLPRARINADAHGLAASYRSAEEILAAHQITEYGQYAPFFEQLGREDEKLRLLTRLDPKDRVAQAISNISGVRLVDCVEGPNGKLMLVNRFARWHFRQALQNHFSQDPSAWYVALQSRALDKLL